MKHLVVISPFGGREVGEAITDAGEIKAILAGENAHHVVRATPEEPALPKTAREPEPTPEPVAAEPATEGAIRGRKSKIKE